MHKTTLMLRGAFQNEKTIIKVQGGLVPEVVTEGPYFSDALEKVSRNLGRKAVEVRKTLCFPEFRSVRIASRLDFWMRKGMTFFVWRNPEGKRFEGHLFIYLIPSSNQILELDDFLESLLQIAPIAPDLCSWRGSDQDSKDWEVTRVNKNALEVIGQHMKTHTHVGYVGVGISLKQAISAVAQIV